MLRIGNNQVKPSDLKIDSLCGEFGPGMLKVCVRICGDKADGSSEYAAIVSVLYYSGQAERARDPMKLWRSAANS